MALEKPIEMTDTGVIARYWRIGQIAFSWPGALSHEDLQVTQIITITMEGYVSQAARRAGKMAIDSRTLTYHSTVRDQAPTQITRKDAYELIGKTGEFEDALLV